MERAGIEHDVLEVPTGAESGPGIVGPLLSKIMSFKPDFLLTVNFLGGDFGGELSSILSGRGCPWPRGSWTIRKISFTAGACRTPAIWSYSAAIPAIPSF
jgi:hypothetical protein